MSHKYCFISFSMTKWDSPWYVRQKLSSELAKVHKVVYVEPRLPIRELLLGIIHGDVHLFPQKKNSHLLVVNRIVFFPKNYKFPMIDRLFDWAYHLYVKFVVLLFSGSVRKVVYVWEPDFASFVDWYKKYPLIYHVYDFYAGYTYKQNNGKEKCDSSHDIEKNLVNNANLLYAVTEKLCDRYHDEFGIRPALLPNAVQDCFFSMRQIEEIKDRKVCEAIEEIKSISKITVGYSGSIKGSLDLDILHDIADKRDDIIIVLVGMVRRTNIPEYDTKLERFLSLQNVRHFGPFDIHDLPLVLSEIDMFVMIYSQDKKISQYFAFPAKMFEYFALGKPVISTPQPAVDQYSDYVIRVHDSNEMMSAIDNVGTFFSGDKLNKMKACAAANTWRVRVEVIEHDLNEVWDN